MKKFSFIAVFILIALAWSACTSYNYYKAGATHLNVRQYRSFTLVPEGNANTAMPPINSPVPHQLNYINNNKYYNNPAAADRIKQATIAALTAKGLTYSANGNADLLVQYSTTVDRGTRNGYSYPYYGGFYSGWGWGYGWRPFWGGWGGYGGWGGPWGYGGYGGYGYPVREHFKEGVLTIDLIDARTRRVVWRGFGTGELKRNPEKAINDIPKEVEGMFKQLPVTM